MLLAPMLLAAALGQTCVAPTSRQGPPPCAAANVEGCLPGYQRDIDAWGRVIYRCGRHVYEPPRTAQAPPQAVAPAPAPAPVYDPHPRWGRPVAHGDWRRGLAALVLMPGGTTVDRGDTTDGAVGLGLELRGPTGGARLRFGYEYSRPVSLLDVSLKYDFLDGPVSPFLALGAGAAALDPVLMGIASDEEHVWRATGSISVGVDVFLTPDLFASVELKARAFSRDEGLENRAARATTLLFGLGLYF